MEHRALQASYVRPTGRLSSDFKICHAKSGFRVQQSDISLRCWDDSVLGQNLVLVWPVMWFHGLYGVWCFW